MSAPSVDTHPEAKRIMIEVIGRSAMSGSVQDRAITDPQRILVNHPCPTQRTRRQDGGPASCSLTPWSASLVVMAAREAVVGLFIEISFIATFTQRYFGK